MSTIIPRKAPTIDKAEGDQNAPKGKPDAKNLSQEAEKPVFDGDFKFTIPKCPTCGKAANSVMESLMGNAGIDQLKDGSYQYCGETDVNWDSQKPVYTDGELTLFCQSGHYWQSNTVDGGTHL